MDIFEYKKITMRQIRFKWSEQYEILDENEVIIGRIKLNMPPVKFLLRNLFTLFAGSEFDLLNQDNEIIQQYKKNFGFNPYTLVYDNSGKLIAKYKKKITGFTPIIKAFDENDNYIAMAKGDLMAHNVQILDPENRILAKIKMPWFKETIRHMDYYQMEFLLEPNEIELKKKIFGLLVYIDEEFHSIKT